MLIKRTSVCIAAAAILALVACSSDDDSPADTPANETSEENQELETPVNTGEPGGDTTRIAGLWDGSVSEGTTTDVVYWNIAANGVLTQYDYQQDGTESATDGNCYLVGDPITVTPEDGDTYSIATVGVTAVRDGDTLNVTFLDADSNDLDGDGDKTEMPAFSMPLLTTPVLSDLNACN